MDLKTISATLALLGSSGLQTACDKKPPENEHRDAAEIPVDGAQPPASDAVSEKSKPGEGKCGEGKCGEASCGGKPEGESKDGEAAVPVAGGTPEGEAPKAPSEADVNDDDKS